MKRKVIQIGDSTQLISLPRSWAKKFNINKGDELDVLDEQNRLVITTTTEINPETVELDISNLGLMIPRCVHALYKRGVDEIKFTFEEPSIIQSLQESLGKEAVGFEIIDQGKNYCVVRYVSGQFEDFEPILRRTFLLLLSMAEEIVLCIERKDYNHLPNIALMEQTNNRFTTVCRRYLNRKATLHPTKIGASYYLIEDIENLADEYKYLCTYLYGKNKEHELKIDTKTVELLKMVNNLLREFYEIFYKFDRQKLIMIANQRKKQIPILLSALENAQSKHEKIILHHILIIIQKIFNFLGPYLVMELK